MATLIQFDGGSFSVRKTSAGYVVERLDCACDGWGHRYVVGTAKTRGEADLLVHGLAHAAPCPKGGGQ